MRIGRVTADGRAQVYVSVTGPSGVDEDVDALLDTGFNGTLALPPERIAALGLRQRSKTIVVLASGEKRHVPTYRATIQSYRATIQFGMKEQTALIVEAGEPLVGMALMWGCNLQIECVNGGRVVMNER